MEDVLPVSLRLESSLSLSKTRLSTYFTKEYIYRLLLILVIVLPLSVFLLSFFFQWRIDTSYLISTLQSMDRKTVHQAGVPSSSHPPAEVNSDTVEDPKLFNQSLHALQDLNRWSFNHNVSSNAQVKICITSTTSASLNRLLPWIFYHKVIGIDSFLLFVEGDAASSSSLKVLKSIPGVHAFSRTAEFEQQQAKSRIWNDTRMTVFANKPCNHELFFKQILNMEMAIVMARDAGMEWIFHLDTDELLHPAGTREYSMIELLAKFPKEVDTVVFHNYEAAVERDDIKDPFSEVSMFKKNLGHLPTEINPELYNESFHNNKHFFMAYGNGKSGARIEDDLSPNGAHRWEYDHKIPKEVTMDEAAVLHYTYSRFADLTLRRDRCNCKPTVEEADKCFFLEFDRTAFIVASNSTEPKMHQWYRKHVVWNNYELKLKLLKGGILTRIYTPLVIIRRLIQSGIFASTISTASATSPGTVDSSSVNNTSTSRNT